MIEQDQVIVGAQRGLASGPDLSLVVPVYNEREAIPGLLEEMERVCADLALDSEIIVVDDGSTDGTREFLERVACERDLVRVIGLRRNFGKSEALMAGFRHSSGEILITLDGDGQDDPAEIPALIEKLDQGYDLVSGWKRHRRDPPLKRWSSHLFNRVTARLSGLPLHDFNCGLKAYRGRCARSLDVYGELHRYIPVLATQAGWRVGEVPVNHRPRMHGVSKYGVARYRRGLFDLLTILFMGRYRQRPMHLFGGIGLILGLTGVAICAYLAILKLGGAAIGHRPLLLLGALLIVLGAQFFTFGLLGQLALAIANESGRSKARNYELVRGGTEHDDAPAEESAGARGETPSFAPHPPSKPL